MLENKDKNKHSVEKAQKRKKNSKKMKKVEKVSAKQLDLNFFS